MLIYVEPVQMFSAWSAADGIPGWRAGLAACEGEVSDLRLQAGAPTKEDQKTKKLHAYSEPL